MKQGSPDEARLIRYLLGELRPEEQARIEEQYLADPGFHEDLRATERDLIDQYVHGELPKPEAFERSFLSSPSRRRKVEFARALMRSLAEAPVVMDGSPSGDERGSWLTPVRRFLTIPYRRWHPVAAALVVLVAAGLLILARQRPSPPDHLARVPDRTRETRPERPTGPPPERGQPQPPESAPPLRVATLALAPTLTRDSGEPPLLVIGGNGEVRLELQLEAGGYASYRAVLRTPEGEEVWREDRLRPRRAVSGETVGVSVPASRFSSQDYVVKLSGVTAEGVEEVASYYFRVRDR